MPRGGGSGEAISFGILGPLEVLGSDGAPIEVPGARRRALVLRLLVSANEFVSGERLREDVWRGEAARSTLASNISWLRRRLGESRLRTGSGAYALAVDPSELDADRFESALAAARGAVDAGDHARGVELLSAAIGSWRGPALADLAQGGDASWATGTITRLEEERALATEALLESRLALGQHHGVAAQARFAVDEEPLREQRWATLMLALYRAGRQAEALRAFQTLRAVLAEELGIEPSSVLVALDEAIVLQKPELDWTPPVPPNQAPPVATTTRTGPDRAGVQGSGAPPGRGVHNLAVQRTSFVGREHELSRLGELLETPSLVSIVGPGGIGKTRLATEAALRALGRDLAGVWLVPLSAVSDQRLLASSVASAMGVLDRGERGTEEAVLDRLGAAPCLVVVDNCEHVLGACAELIARWLRGCPELSVVATSREPLGLAEEHVLRLSSLSDAAALTLLAERAAQARAGFALSAANQEAMSEICRRLEGIPLALELAAARLASFSPAQVAERLADTLGALDLGRRDLDARHRTLRAALDWSYQLLDEKGRATIRRLAVFRGGFSAAAAEAVAAAAFEVLATLVSQSLVESDPDAQDPRFALLEPVRQYAWSLAGTAEREATQQRHCAWVVALAKEASRGVLFDQARWVERLRSEHANVEAAIEWSLRRPDDTSALTIVGSLGYYWFSAGQYQAMGWIEAALESADGAPTHLRARALLAGATLAQLRPLDRTSGRAQAAGSPGIERSAAWAREAAEIFRAEGSRRNVAWALFWGVRALHRFDEPTARQSLAEALKLFRELDDPLGVCWCLSWAAQYAENDGRWAEAEALCSESLELGRATGVDHAVGSTLAQLGRLAVHAGDYRRAVELTGEAVAHYRRVHDQWQLCDVLGVLSRALHSAGDLKGSSTALLEALELADSNGFDDGIVWIFRDIALLLPDDRHEIARTLWIQHPQRRMSERWPDPSLDEKHVRLAASLDDYSIADVRALRGRIPLAREALIQMGAQPEDHIA